jgi:hypothetical protein
MLFKFYMENAVNTIRFMRLPSVTQLKEYQNILYENLASTIYLNVA